MKFALGNLALFRVDWRVVEAAALPAEPPADFDWFFKSSEWPEASRRAREAVRSGKNVQLDEAASCAFVNLCRSVSLPQNHWIDILPHDKGAFDAFLKAWLPFFFKREDAAGYAGRGWKGIRGAGRFEFGHLSEHDVRSVDWKLFDPVPRDAVASRGDGDDAWAEFWVHHMTHIAEEWKGSSKTTDLLLAPAYVKFTKSPVKAKSASTRTRLPTQMSSEEAAKLQREAEAGRPEAQYLYAYILSQGMGVKKDIKQAFQWYLKSAEGGYPPAQYQLSVIYSEGRWVPINQPEAERWYALCADQRDKE